MMPTAFTSGQGPTSNQSTEKYRRFRIRHGIAAALLALTANFFVPNVSQAFTVRVALRSAV